MTAGEPNLWARGRGRHADLYAAEYAKQLERIARIRSSVNASLPVSPPPRPAQTRRWDTAPADLAPPAPVPQTQPIVTAASGLPAQAPWAAVPPASAVGAPDAPARPRRSTRVLVAAAAVVLAAVTGAVIAVRGPDAPASATFRVPGQPTGLATAGGQVWVAGPGAGAVWVLDGASGRPVAPALRTGGTPARLALDPRWAWIADTERGALVRADRAGGGTIRPIPSGPDVTDVAVAAGSVWTASSADGTLRMLDAGGRRRVLHIGARPLALAGDERRVVAADAGAGALLRLWADTGRAAGPPVRLGGTPVDVALAGDRAWVADAGAGTVQRVDLVTGGVGRAVAVGPSTVAVAADQMGVYAVSRGDRTLVRLDAVTGEVRSRVPLDHAPTALALDARHVWIAAGEHEVIRVDR